MIRPYQKFLFFMCDRPAVDDAGDRRCQHLGKPEGVPYAVCAQPVTQQCSQRHDENNIPAQRDDQRFCALAQSLQCTGSGGGDCRDDKADADDAQRGLPGGDGFGVLGEQPHQLPGSKLTDHRARRHDGCAHEQGQLEQLFHPSVLPRTVVVADEGAHSLHEAVGGQVQKGLQFIVDAQHHHIALGEGRQQAVEEGDQQGGQGQIQDGRHTDGVETAFEREVRPQGLPAQMDGRLGGAVDHEVDDESGGLSDAGSQRRAGNAHGRHRAEAEDEDGVQQDVADTARDEGGHGELHPAHGLEELLKGEAGHVHGSEQEDDGGVGHAHSSQSIV